MYGLEPENWEMSALSIVVVGASGDLAKKKIYPALFALYVEVGRVMVVCPVLCWPACYMQAMPALAALWPGGGRNSVRAAREALCALRVELGRAGS